MKFWVKEISGPKKGSAVVWFVCVLQQKGYKHLCFVSRCLGLLYSLRLCSLRLLPLRLCSLTYFSFIAATLFWV